MESSSQELSACYYYPDTYKLEVESSSFEEILNMFEEILQGCSFSDVETTLVGYVTSIIEPVGWTAVWRSTSDFSSLNMEHDFIVEVINVSLEKLEADVLIKSVILERSNECIFNDLKRKIYVKNMVSVPLIELHTISDGDDEELFAKTALSIDYVRFFMTHLARPWDGENDDVVYNEKLLRPRLQLFFDMKNNLLPKNMITKIQSILKQGWRVLKELNSLYSEMNVSDSEAEINEDELIQSMSLRTKLSELQAKMEILENPTIRSFMMKKYVPMRSSKNQPKSCPVTYIVSKHFTPEMISNLSLEPSVTLEFEHSAENAFKYSSSGDKIFIFPGVYQCDTLGWFEGDVAIEGVGSHSEIILEATGNSEVFLNSCSTNIVSLKNVCLKAKSGMLSAVVVHHGEIHLKNCAIDSNKADIGMLLLGGSVASLEDCVIRNSNEDGIQMRSMSTLKISSTQITQCKRHGIMIEAETECQDTNMACTELKITQSMITENGRHGIFLNNVPINELSLKRPPSDFTILKIFPWIKSEIEDSEVDDNNENGVGISTSCKLHTEGATCINKVLPSCPKPEDMNCSALSDLLNEISFTDLNIAKCDILND